MSNLLLRFTGTRALGLLVAGGSALLGSLATGCAGNSDGPDGGSCVPTVTCASAAYDCGQALDNCGNVIECGSCGAGETCGAAGPNVCGVGTCTPATCASLGLTCGPMADGCGTAWSCGDECASGDGAGTGGGSPGTGGAAATGGAPATGGASGTISPLGEGVFSGSGTANNTNDGSGRYAKGTVIRDAQWYRFLVNGWGDWGSSTASWLGTSFTVSMAGATNGAGVPVGYPCMYRS
ncbi:MAG TPA: hypothetical protein VLC09_21020, partial [Polyangiaceae bacterium]|nr:hypothetical protein [Polyangiaceae bacterium]